MGSTTGHTAVALRMGGELYVTESTAKDSYWPGQLLSVCCCDEG